MCGIVGMFSQHPIDGLDLLVQMRDTMRHRGPDDAGIWWSDDKRLGLAHRRLSIIDLSSKGRQPMEDESGQYVVTFNGEIYNHQQLRKDLQTAGHFFRSRSDTEVLLEAYKQWGSDCLKRLVGSFAFAIYNSISDELFLARDRSGEKPLFYKHTDDRFVFASELKALMADPFFVRELDLDQLDFYFTYGYTAADRTILRDTCKLPAGHAMVLSLRTNGLKIWRYWRLPEHKPDNSAHAEDLVEELEALLSRAVARQLVSDVPVGVLLSGGLDSSIITAIAARVCQRPLKTFTVSFKGHRFFDEAPFAKAVADYFGTEHTEFVVEPASVSLLPQLARQFDEPLADHAILPSSMLSLQARTSVTVALGGDGGDELFGGYPHYNYLQKLDSARKYMPANVRKAGALIASRMLPVGTKGRNYLIGFKGDAGSSVSAVNIYFDSHYRSKLLAPLYRSGYRSLLPPESIRAGEFNKSSSMLQNASRVDFQTLMIDDYLVKSDRASMLHSLELRAPFLDHKLIEYAFGRLPDWLRVCAGRRKIILRKLAQRLLPPQFDLERKQGLTLPLGIWFKGDWRAYITDVLCQSDPAIFNHKLIRHLIKAQRLGFSNTNRLFSLVMFELWRREYRVSLPAGF